MLNPASVSKKNLDFIPKVLLRIKELFIWHFA